MNIYLRYFDLFSLLFWWKLITLIRNSWKSILFRPFLVVICLSVSSFHFVFFSSFPFSVFHFPLYSWFPFCFLAYFITCLYWSLLSLFSFLLFSSLLSLSFASYSSFNIIIIIVLSLNAQTSPRDRF